MILTSRGHYFILQTPPPHSLTSALGYVEYLKIRKSVPQIFLLILSIVSIDCQCRRLLYTHIFIYFSFFYVATSTSLKSALGYVEYLKIKKNCPLEFFFIFSIVSIDRIVSVDIYKYTYLISFWPTPTPYILESALGYVEYPQVIKVFTRTSFINTYYCQYR